MLKAQKCMTRKSGSLNLKQMEIYMDSDKQY